MTTPLTENPAVVDPARTLNLTQKDALTSIAFFRHQRIDGGMCHIGTKRFSMRTIVLLQKLELVRFDRHGVALTMGGQLAADKLKRGVRDGHA
jgi:hypothetical protein